jgi:hypothetical protein
MPKTKKKPAPAAVATLRGGRARKAAEPAKAQVKVGEFYKVETGDQTHFGEIRAIDGDTATIMRQVQGQEIHLQDFDLKGAKVQQITKEQAYHCSINPNTYKFI